MDDDVIVLVSGGNIDPSFSWRILYEQSVPNLLVIRVAMPDRPGELLRMLLPIAHLNVNIIDVDVNRLDARPRMGERIVELCVAISAQAQADNMLSALRAKGYQRAGQPLAGPARRPHRQSLALHSHRGPQGSTQPPGRPPMSEHQPDDRQEIDDPIAYRDLSDRFRTRRYGKSSNG